MPIKLGDDGYWVPYLVRMLVVEQVLGQEAGLVLGLCLRLLAYLQ